MVYILTLSETEIKYTKLKQKYSQVNEKIIEEKFNDIVSLKHYYNKLYKMISKFIYDKNWIGLKDYFEKYISPVHTNYIENDLDILKLELCKIPLIKILLLDTIINGSYKAQVFIEITEVIEDTIISEPDLFIILNEWISNALDAVNNRSGFVYILIASDDNSISIKVYNPIYEDIDISLVKKRGYTTKIGHAGLGLYDVTKIISSYDNVQYFNYVELNKYIQCLIIWRA